MTKSYTETQNEITKDEVFEGLLAYGMFPDKIAPLFSSVDFYIYTKEMSCNFSNKHRNCIKYESIRHINTPRVLSVPSPFGYHNLVKHISAHWDKVQGLFNANTKKEVYKVSRIHIRKLIGKKHIFEMNYKSESSDGAPEEKIAIKANYRTEADISSCFPSIYSHAVDWAISKKDKAKKGESKKWAKKLDKLTRNIKHGETNGILIGPHASNILSEIILTKIDSRLSKKYKYVRYIDDYVCYTETQKDAENFLLDLSRELKVYELRLNDKKTKIKKTPDGDYGWVNKLNSFDFNESSNGYVSRKKMRLYIDYAVSLAVDNNIAVLSYAFKVLSRKRLGGYAIDVLADRFHALLLSYPYLVQIADDFMYKPFKLSTEKIAEIANDLYSQGIKNNTPEACSYALYWAIEHEFLIDSLHPVRDVTKLKDCISLTVLYIYARKHSFNDFTEELHRHAIKLQEDGYFEEYWLFIYEVLQEDELKDGDFKKMKKEGVTFIDEPYRFGGGL